MTDDDERGKIIRFPPPIIKIKVGPLSRPLPDFMQLYDLVNREPVKMETVADWTDAIMRRRVTGMRTGIDPWRIDKTIIGAARISTVFIGIDHAFFGGKPMLFETMIFGGSLDQFQNRCCTWQEAEAMHAEAVKLVRGGHLKVIK